MKEDYLKNWNLMSHEMQKSLQSMMELNTRTLQNFKFLKPEDLSSMRQPTEILGKQMSLAMENSQHLLNYMHKSFEILENVFLSFSQEMREKAGQPFKQAQSMAETMQQEVKVKTRKKAASKKAAPKEEKTKAASASSTRKNEKTEKKASPLKKKTDKTEAKLSSSPKKEEKGKLSSAPKKEAKGKLSSSPKKEVKAKLSSFPQMQAKEKLSSSPKLETKGNKAKQAKTGSKLNTTVLERKMGMTETKPNLLVNPIDEVKADKLENKREKLEQSLTTGHPLNKQNPFQK